LRFLSTSIEITPFEWGKDKIADLKDVKEGAKIDVIIGADIIFWPDSLPPLMQSLNVYSNILISCSKEALDINPNCEILISYYSRNESVNKNLDQKVKEFGFSLFTISSKKTSWQRRSFNKRIADIFIELQELKIISLSFCIVFEFRLSIKIRSIILICF
jgi:hypothetical protein